MTWFYNLYSLSGELPVLWIIYYYKFSFKAYSNAISLLKYFKSLYYVN